MIEDRDNLPIDPYEKAWIYVSLITMGAFFIAVTIAGFSGGIQVPAPEQRVDPNTVQEQGPFSEPGLRELSDGKYEVYMIAQTWLFNPRQVEVPAGAEVTYYITSIDVQHGFKVQGTNANIMVIPGQVSTLTLTLEEPGDYSIICHEYCGAGHAAMAGTITVLEE